MIYASSTNQTHGANLMNYTEAKKQRVINLGNQGYARTEIAKLTKLTPKQVGSILRMSYL